jgi:beta-fructofuranosidase
MIPPPDPHTPLYHITSPSPHTHCFDPNGAIYYKNRYHLFYIFQDPKLQTGPEFWQKGHCWGHLSSTNLTQWHRHPTALVPDHTSPEGAIFSGCAILDKHGTPTLIYHGVHSGTSIATPLDDNLDVWQKSPYNPVIPEPKTPADPGYKIYNVFDPAVWLQNGTYYAALGGKVKPHDLHDTAYLFSSPDLIHWQYLHPLYTPSHHWTTDRDDTGCPKFFPLGDRHYLLCISHATGTRYYSGTYQNHTFTPTAHHPINYPGGCTFAPETVLDANNRRLMWAWAVDQRADWYKEGKHCVLTLPRVLSPGPAGTLLFAPAPELQSLRTNHRQFQNLTLTPSHPIPLPNLSTQSLELSLILTWQSPATFALKIHASPNGNQADAEHTLITFDTTTRSLSIDTTKTTLANDGFRPWPLDFWSGVEFQNMPIQSAPVPPTSENSLTLRLFIDRSILELFADDTLCLAHRAYPTRPDSHHASLHAISGQIQIPTLDAWDMNPLTFT